MATLVDGTRTSGADIRTQNVTACVAVANIVKSSLGPVGLDKMLVDQVGDVTITNDGATILKMLDVEHPAARVLVDLADLQDREIGDGTTSVVILASELLRRGNELIKARLHPTTVMNGYRLAMREAVKYVKSHLIVKADTLTRENLIAAARTSMSSKIIGTDSAFFSEMVVDAVKRVEKVDKVTGRSTCDVSNINILKAHGRSSKESRLVGGFALNCMRASQLMPKRVEGARLALLDFNLQRHRMAMGVSVLVKDPAELERVRAREADITKERIQKLLAAGANVFLTTKAIDDLCQKYLVEAGAMGVRRVSPGDLARIAAATGGQILTTLADMEGEETVDPDTLGTAASVSEERVGDGEMIYIRDPSQCGATSLVLRGANSLMLDEMTRALNDALMVVKRCIESRSLVVGGGAVEAALHVYLHTLASTVGTREQLAIQQFADAMLVIPKTLTVNAAKDVPELVARLCARHARAQRMAAAAAGGAAEGGAGEGGAGAAAAAAAAGGAVASSSADAAGGDAADADAATLSHSGLDLVAGTVTDNLARGVVEPAISKIKSLRFATEAAVTILRIDDMIKLNPKEEEGGGHGH